MSQFIKWGVGSDLGIAADIMVMGHELKVMEAKVCAILGPKLTYFIH